MLRPHITAIFFAVFLVVSPVAPPVYAANQSVAEDGKRKINLSGRQRMLSQQIAKAACFASLDFDRAGHVAMVAEAYRLFDTTLAALRNGSDVLGLDRETHAGILSELSDVDALWASYGPAVNAFVGSNGADEGALTSIALQNLETLRQMNEAVGKFEDVHGAKDLDAGLAAAINLAGRQRMLSQKASKEFCFSVEGRDAERYRADMLNTVTEFNTAMIALRNGSEELGIPKPPSEEIANQLALVDELWSPLSFILLSAALGTKPSESDIDLVAKQNNRVLVEMNRAVDMYEQQ